MDRIVSVPEFTYLLIKVLNVVKWCTLMTHEVEYGGQG